MIKKTKQSSENDNLVTKKETSDLKIRIISSVFLLLFLVIYVGLSVLYTQGSKTIDGEQNIKHVAVTGYLNWIISMGLVGAGMYELIKAQGISKSKWYLYVLGIVVAMFLFFFPVINKNNWDLTAQMDVESWYKWYYILLAMLLGIFVFLAIPYFNNPSFRQTWTSSLLLLLYGFVLVFGFKGFNIISLSMTGLVFKDGANISKKVIPTFGFNTIIWVWGIVILTDTFAYFGGRKFGKTPLAPKISPKKTWEGSGIGSGVAIILGALYSILFFYLKQDYAPLHEGLVSAYSKGKAIPGVILFLLTVVISFAGQIGDLFFSWYKRVFNIKDFSKIIPGHGGILDRLDSFVFVFFIMFFVAISIIAS